MGRNAAWFSTHLEADGPLALWPFHSSTPQIGRPPHEAHQSAMRFRQHNLELFEKMYPHSKDRSKLIAVMKQGRQQLEEQMANERAQQAQRRPQGWGGDS